MQHYSEEEIAAKAQEEKIVTELVEEWGLQKLIDFCQAVSDYTACSTPIQEGLFDKENIALDAHFLIRRFKGM